MKSKVPTVVAARILEKSENFIRYGLQAGKLPFGMAVRMGGRWSYHISPVRLAEYSGVPVEEINRMSDEFYGHRRELMSGYRKKMTV